MAHYIVTGGAGFIGSHIVEKLVDAGEEVSVFDNLSTGFFENIVPFEDKIHFISGDIRNRDALEKAFQNADFVLHQAALPSVQRSIEDPNACNDNNINGTLNVLLAARNTDIKRVVFASSSSVYGFNPTIPKQEDQQTIPQSPYALSKLTGEHYCRLFYEIFRLETVCLRYFNVFGPRQNPDSQYSAVIPAFITALLNNEIPIIHSDGEQSRDFTYVENVANANLKACIAPKAAGKVFNIGCGERTTINQLYRTINKAMGVRISPRYQPERPGDVRHSLADISRARRYLDYDHQVDLLTGLKYTVDYYRSIFER